MTGRMDGRVAVVTGGASGIGEATVRRFVLEGAQVVIADVQTERGIALANELGAATRFVMTDVTDESAIAGAVAIAVSAYGGIDVMFNNAGIIGVTGPISTIGYDDYRKTMSVLVDSVVLGTKHAAAAMIEQGRGGSIISTSSVAAVSGGLGSHTYSAAKAAVIGLMQSVAAELWPYAIRANAVLPGRIMTPMTAAIRSRSTIGGTAGPASDDNPATMHAERRAYPDDVASAVVFLASDDGRFVTGEALLVDGGLVRAGGPSPFAIGAYQTPTMIGRSGV
jgi:NAD(P)-dependent dehydrogenase (short-subunit alcohol dehydrogenase family)